MEPSGFRDLVAAFDSARYQVRTGRLSVNEFREFAACLLEQAKASLDPKVARIFVPAVIEAIEKPEIWFSGVVEVLEGAASDF